MIDTNYSNVKSYFCEKAERIRLKNCIAKSITQIFMANKLTISEAKEILDDVGFRLDESKVDIS